MLNRDIFLHLRLSFSFFLLPVFLFALSQSGTAIYQTDMLIIFVVLHFFIYPASNAYNSYTDKDRGSIGGLKHPPPVSRKLYQASVLLDSAGIALALLINWKAALLCAGYAVISRAYSWRRIRIKKYPVLSWLIVSFFQGGYTFAVISMIITRNISLFWLTTEKNLLGILITTLLIGGIYPVSQIFQHEEDQQRGDITLSYLLGKKATLLFSFGIYAMALLLSGHYFFRFYSFIQFYILLAFLSPPFLYMIHWLLKIRNDEAEASYSRTMNLYYIATPCLSVCFIVLMLLNS